MKEIQWRYSTPEAVWQTGTPISAKGKANLRLNGIEYQKMFGFGGCFNEQGYEALKTLPENKQDSLLKELFAADAIGNQQFRTGCNPRASFRIVTGTLFIFMAKRCLWEKADMNFPVIAPFNVCLRIIVTATGDISDNVSCSR